MPLLADIGIPMIFLYWPLMIGALVPVILIEALLIRRWVPLSKRDAFVGIGKANLLSTLIGVPLAWLAMLALEYAVMIPTGLAAERWKWQLDSPVFQLVGFFISAAWLVPAESYLHWTIPAATAVLLVPCFFVSVLIERRACASSWKSAEPAQVRRGVFAVNLVSYALLFILSCGWVTYELTSKGVRVDRHRNWRSTVTNGTPAQN